MALVGFTTGGDLRSRRSPRPEGYLIQLGQL